MQTTSGRWLIPALVAGVAAPTFVAFWIGDRPELGAAWAAVSIVFALTLIVGRRSDTIRMLRGDEDDERTLALEYRSMTAVALVLIAALAGLFLAAGIRGESGIVYGVLLIVAELAHIGSLAVLNRKG